jgi:hypothetical protein
MRSCSGRAGDAAASLYLYGSRERRFRGLTRGSSANLTLPDCVRVARFYRELGFAANQGLGE